MKITRYHHLWHLLRTPLRILLSGAAALLVLAGARLLGLPPLAGLLSDAPARSAAFLVFGVGLAFAAFCGGSPGGWTGRRRRRGLRRR